MTNLDRILKSRDITLPTKVPIVKAMISPVVRYRCELEHKAGWPLKSWPLWTVVLESPLGCKGRNPKGNQSWIFTRKTDAEAEAPILGPPDVKIWFVAKDLAAGKDWRQEEKGMTEDEMVGWHHWVNGHEFEQALGDSEGQEGLSAAGLCCSSLGHKESDQTERLNNNNTSEKFLVWFRPSNQSPSHCLHTNANWLLVLCTGYIHTNPKELYNCKSNKDFFQHIYPPFWIVLILNVRLSLITYVILQLVSLFQVQPKYFPPKPSFFSIPFILFEKSFQSCISQTPLIFLSADLVENRILKVNNGKLYAIIQLIILFQPFPLPKEVSNGRPNTCNRASGKYILSEEVFS